MAALLVAISSRGSTARLNASRVVASAATSAAHPILTPYLHAAPHQVPAALRPKPSASVWTPLTNPPPFGTPGTMLLESDGSVLVHDEPNNSEQAGSNMWWKLTPDASGSYVDGTWSQIASMPSGYDPEYFASAVLPDGRMIVEGGEYIDNNGVWSNEGAIYDPTSNTWTAVSPPPGWTNIGDAASEVLANGTFMLQHPCNTCTTDPDNTVDAALLNAKTLTWTVIPGTGKNDPNDEEGWTLEPNGGVLALDTWAVGNTQLFDPQNDKWIFSGDTANGGNPIDPFPVVEIGPQVEMPGGNTFVVGAGTSEQEGGACTTDTPAQTALYQNAARIGTWAAGPSIPTVGGEQYDSADGPGSVLPDGNVLFDVSPCVYSAPLGFLLYNASSNTLSTVPDVPNAANDSTYYTRMLALPNGQVLFDDNSNQMEVYTAGGSPQSSWAPTISSLSSSNLAPGSTYSVSGTQLAGLDQGAAYGDDAQSNTNFPLVRITNTASGAVTYARTHDWTSVSVASGASSSTQFTLPAGTPAGASTLVVVANGIASAPQTVTVS